MDARSSPIGGNQRLCTPKRSHLSSPPTPLSVLSILISASECVAYLYPPPMCFHTTLPQKRSILRLPSIYNTNTNINNNNAIVGTYLFKTHKSKTRDVPKAHALLTPVEGNVASDDKCGAPVRQPHAAAVRGSRVVRNVAIVCRELHAVTAHTTAHLKKQKQAHTHTHEIIRKQMAKKKRKTSQVP